MRTLAAAGYSPSAPTESHVIAEGRPIPSTQTRPLVYAHQHGSLADVGITEIKHGIPAWANAGLVAITSDLGGATTFGNPTAESRFGDAVTYIRAQRPCKQDKVIIVACSMGGIAACNWAVNNPSQVAAMAMIVPAIDLEDIHDNDRGGHAAGIEAAYGGLAAFQTSMVTRNPIDHADDLTGIPIKIWYSTNDGVCLPAITEAFATASGAELESLGAVFHSNGTLSPTAVFNYVKQYAS